MNEAHPEDRLRAAAADTHAAMEPGYVPEFEPRRGRPGRVAAVAFLALAGLTAWAGGVFGGGGAETIDTFDPAATSITASTTVTTATTVTSATITTVPSVSTTIGPDDADSPGVTHDDPVPLAEVDRPSGTLLEPDFGALVQRLTESEPGTVTAPVHSGTSAYDASGRYLLLYRTNGAAQVSGGPVHVVLDQDDRTVLAELALDATDIEDVSWHPSIAGRLLYPEAGTNRLLRIDLGTGSTTPETEHAFDGCDEITLGQTSGSTSFGTAAMGLLCLEGGDTSWLVFDLESGVETARAPAAIDAAPLPLRSGSGFVVASADGFVVLDPNLNQRSTIEAETASFTTAIDGAGRDVIVTAAYDEPAGAIITYDVVDGTRTVISGPESGDPYPPSGISFSHAAADRPTLVAMATGPLDPGASTSGADEVLSGEILLIDLATGVPHRLAHHRATTTADGTWGRPMVAISPDGSWIVFSSDWGTGTVDTYELYLN